MSGSGGRLRQPRQAGALLLAGAVIAVIASAPPGAARPEDAPEELERRAAWLRREARSLGGAGRLDAAPLLEAVGEARLVLLGEPCHGDGAAFALKRQLVLALHEQAGFEVLAFEAGPFEAERAWEALRAGTTPGTAAGRGVSIWSYSGEVAALLEDVGRLARSERPLRLCGFDSQFNFPDSVPVLVRALEEAGVGAGAAAEVGATLVALLDPAGPRAAAPPLDAAGVRRVAGALGPAEPAEPRALLREVLESLAVELEARDEPTSWAARERRMADVLVWLLERRFPGRKLVVWAANYHVLSRPELLQGPAADVPLGPGSVTMGQLLRERLGERMYAVGFTALRGQWATSPFAAPAPVPAAAPADLEGLFVRAGLERAFLDLRPHRGAGSWIDGELTARLAWNHARVRGPWTRAYDGVLVYPESRPSQLDPGR